MRTPTHTCTLETGKTLEAIESEEREECYFSKCGANVVHS